MALDALQAKRMVTACERAGVRYATAFDQRFHAAHLALRGLIADGTLGRITRMRVYYASWMDPAGPTSGPWARDTWRAERVSGSAMADLAPHGLDLAQYLLGEPLAQVACLMQRCVFDYVADDGAVVIARSASGVLLDLSVAYNSPETFPKRELEVTGTLGRARTANTIGQLTGGELYLQLSEQREERLVDLSAVQGSPFQIGIERYSRSLLDDEPFGFSARGDLHTMRLLEQAQRQGLSGLQFGDMIDLRDLV